MVIKSKSDQIFTLFNLKISIPLEEFSSTFPPTNSKEDSPLVSSLTSSIMSLKHENEMKNVMSSIKKKKKILTYLNGLKKSNTIRTQMIYTYYVRI